MRVEYRPTIGAGVLTELLVRDRRGASVHVDHRHTDWLVTGVGTQLRVRDTAGNPQFAARSISGSLQRARGSDGCVVLVLCFSLADIESFTAAQSYLNLVNQQEPKPELILYVHPAMHGCTVTECVCCHLYSH